MKFILFLFIFNFLSGEILFTDISDNAGVSFSGMSEAVCVFDYNNDGLDDILFTTRNGGTIHLYENSGGMNFTDVSIESNLGVVMEARTAVAGDYDNDGDLDLFIGATIGESKFFRNNGNGTFQDITNLTGINISEQVRGCTWFDFDQDGFLDLYIGLLYEPNLLFKNNADGTFVDIAQTVGATGPFSAGIIMGLGAIDYDRDGDQDIFITQDNNNGNILLENQGNGYFLDISQSSQTNLQVMGMGVAFGDINRDGFFDFYTTNLYENSLLLNSSDGTFTDISFSSGTQDIPGSMGWGTFFFDANNDGWLDIYNNNETAFGGVYNSLMINQGDLTFSMLGESCGAILANNGYGSSFSDFDHDGDLDMILVGHSSNIGSINLLQNDSDNLNWIILNLEQAQGNLFAVGATVELYHGTNYQLNYVSAGNGYCSQNTLDVHFGLDDMTYVDSVIVTWPDNQKELFFDLQINTRNHLIRGSGSLMMNTDHVISNPQNFLVKDIYPNPFNSEAILMISSYENINPKIEIFDLTGRLIKSNIYSFIFKGDHRVKISLNNNTSGLYFVRVSTSNTIQTKKIYLLK
ncbi:MAG: hypothetical protein CMG55_08210 [Candidatus Marinimicrobia bacterium]|nr:hypothetical protein [Candidatus Neomarinimicrobiota bacterium]